MKFSHLFLGSALLACASVAQAAPITVNNGSFETNVFTSDASGLGDTWNALPTSAPGVWEFSNNNIYGVYRRANSVNSSVHFATAADGNYVLNLGNFPPITQALSYTVAAGDQFTLDFYVAKTLTNLGGGTLTASILVGGTPIATDATFASTAALGAWDHKTLTGTATGTGALTISFAPGTSSPWLDNVTMSVVAVPEPASLSFLSLSTLALLRRRR